MSLIATIYEKPKEARPYPSARHECDDGPILETLFLEGLDAKAAVSYETWRPFDARESQPPSLFDAARKRSWLW